MKYKTGNHQQIVQATQSYSSVLPKLSYTNAVAPPWNMLHSSGRGCRQAESLLRMKGHLSPCPGCKPQPVQRVSMNQQYHWHNSTVIHVISISAIHLPLPFRAPLYSLPTLQLLSTDLTCTSVCCFPTVGRLWHCEQACRHKVLYGTFATVCTIELQKPGCASIVGLKKGS